MGAKCVYRLQNTIVRSFPVFFFVRYYALVRFVEIVVFVFRSGGLFSFFLRCKFSYVIWCDYIRRWMNVIWSVAKLTYCQQASGYFV